MVLGTSLHDFPSVTPVFFALGQNLVFYWLSELTAEHSRQVLANENASIVIHDSHAPPGTGIGFYARGHAVHVTDKEERIRAINLLTDKSHHLRVRVKDLQNPDSVRQVFKFVAQKIWTNGDIQIGNLRVDRRKELSMDDFSPA